MKKLMFSFRMLLVIMFVLGVAGILICLAGFLYLMPCMLNLFIITLGMMMSVSLVAASAYELFKSKD